MTNTDLFLNPFNKDSAYHRPVGTGAVYASPTDAATLDWRKSNGIYVNVGPNWGFSIAKSVITDPLVNITCDGQFGCAGLPVTMRVPKGFNGGTTSDANSGIYDATKLTLHELYRFHLSNGRYTASLNYPIPVTGKGHKDPGQTGYVGISASGQSELLTTLRGFEVNNPGKKIQHALNLAIPSAAISHCASMLSQKIIWPASAKDNFASGNTGHIPYGALFAIPPMSRGGPYLAGLGLSEPGLRVARALRDYGAYVYDASQCVTMRADQFVGSTVQNQVVKDLGKVYKYMLMVKNNGPYQTASGGGTPIAPNCAYNSS